MVLSSYPTIMTMVNDDDGTTADMTSFDMSKLSTSVNNLEHLLTESIVAAASNIRDRSSSFVKNNKQQETFLCQDPSFDDLEWMNHKDSLLMQPTHDQQQEDHLELPHNSLLDMPSLDHCCDDNKKYHQETVFRRVQDDEEPCLRKRQSKLSPRHVLITPRPSASTKVDSRCQWTIRTSQSLFDPDELEQLSMGVL